MDPSNPRRNSGQHPSRTQPNWRRSSNTSPARGGSSGVEKDPSAPQTNRDEPHPTRTHSISSPPSTANIPSLSHNPFHRRKTEAPPPKLPKHFDPPMTCFFWYQTGRCSKSDEACIYAHADTGCYAKPPVSTGMGEAVAGKKGDRYLSLTAAGAGTEEARERALREGEKALEAEREAFEREKAVMREGVRVVGEAASELQRCGLGGAAEAAVEVIVGAVKAMGEVG